MLLDDIPVHHHIGLRAIASIERDVVFRVARDHPHPAGNVLFLFGAFRPVVKKAPNLNRFWRVEFLAASQLSYGFNCAGLEKLRPEFFEQRSLRAAARSRALTTHDRQAW